MAKNRTTATRGASPPSSPEPKPSPAGGTEITTLLAAWRSGNQEAADSLLEKVYPRLRAIARRQLAASRFVSLDPTEVVHELYLTLAGRKQPSYEDRAHFFGLASRVVRDVVVSHARRKRRLKRGGGLVAVDSEAVTLVSPNRGEPVDVLALHEALEDLSQICELSVRIVEVRYFGGLDLEETAEALGIGRTTVVRKWRYARAWLRGRLEVSQP